MSGTGRASRRRVHRGEGEVTQWPRGVVDYVPSGREESLPGPEEDAVRNRLLLANRLVSVLRSRGVDTDRFVRELTDVERSLRRGDRTDAAARIDRLLGELDVRLAADRS